MNGVGLARSSKLIIIRISVFTLPLLNVGGWDKKGNACVGRESTWIGLADFIILETEQLTPGAHRRCTLATMDFTTNTSSLQNVQGQFLGNWNPEKEISDSHPPQFTS